MTSLRYSVVNASVGHAERSIMIDGEAHTVTVQRGGVEMRPVGHAGGVVMIDVPVSSLADFSGGSTIICTFEREV